MAAARAAWPTESAEGIGGIVPERLVFLDECGVLTNMARLWGRSPRGTRAVATVPCGHWQRLTVLGALGISGMLATMSIEAATSGAVFLAYLDQVLLPELGVNLRKDIMRREIIRIDFKRALKPFDRFLQELLLFRFIRALEF